LFSRPRHDGDTSSRGAYNTVASSPWGVEAASVHEARVMKKIHLKPRSSDRLSGLLESDLNEPQRAAATAPDGYNLILAGPGSGKTRVITYRVAHLIASGVPGSSILLVTFTRRAAREMVGRLETLIGAEAGQVWAGTFHHVGNRILRRSAEVLGLGSNFTILDSEDQTDLVKLAMDDSGLFGSGKMSPKPATVHHLLSFAANVGLPLATVIAERSPELSDWSDAIVAVRQAYTTRKRAANALDYDDLLLEWDRLLREFPDQLAAQGKMFRHLLIDEMQDTNRLQVGLVETIAAAGAGNLTAVGDDAQSIYRFRGANYDNILKFADRHPGARVFRLEINYRSTPEIVAFTNSSIAHNLSGFPKTLVSARPPGSKPMRVPLEDAYEEAYFVCQQVLEEYERGVPLNRMAVLYRNHFDSIVLQGELVARGIVYSVRSGLRFFEQAHIKDVLCYLRIVVNPRDEPAWRRLFLHLPGVGPAKASALCERITGAGDPFTAMASAETMKLVPEKGKGYYAGFVVDLRRIRATDANANPSEAIGAILKGGYPNVVRAKYERPQNRITDIEQFALLAAKYDSLERMIAELLLAGDVYGMESAGAGSAEETLVLTTVHQAKGLEWSHVFMIRLVEESFPHRRALEEDGGEDEERRIFYVGVTRAMDELTLTYPLTLARGGYGPNVLTIRSRFLTEIDPELFEPVEVTRDRR
jgi:DNA helicase II / ATP-dependent DNA helicase PcrA